MRMSLVLTLIVALAFVIVMHVSPMAEAQYPGYYQFGYPNHQYYGTSNLYDDHLYGDDAYRYRYRYRYGYGAPNTMYYGSYYTLPWWY